MFVQSLFVSIQCVKALEGFVESVKSDGERALPKDGTVHEVTSNALIFTEQLLEYAATLSPMLQRDPSLSAALSNLSRGVDQSHMAKALLGAYISKYLIDFYFVNNQAKCSCIFTLLFIMDLFLFFCLHIQHTMYHIFSRTFHVKMSLYSDL